MDEYVAKFIKVEGWVHTERQPYWLLLLDNKYQQRWLIQKFELTLPSNDEISTLPGNLILRDSSQLANLTLQIGSLGYVHQIYAQRLQSHYSVEKLKSLMQYSLQLYPPGTEPDDIKIDINALYHRGWEALCSLLILSTALIHAGSASLPPTSMPPKKLIALLPSPRLRHVVNELLNASSNKEDNYFE